MQARRGSQLVDVDIGVYALPIPVAVVFCHG